MELAKNLGAKGLFLANNEALGADEAAGDLGCNRPKQPSEEIYSYLKLKQRIVTKANHA